MTEQNSIYQTVIIGTGNLGSALAVSFRESIFNLDPKKLWLIDRDHNEASSLAESLNCSCAKDIASLPSNIDIYLIAVKPQNAQEIFNALLKKESVKRAKAIVSVMAGVSTCFIRDKLPWENICICRAMPNLAVKVKKSITVLFFSAKSSVQPFITALFASVGKVLTVKDEELIDAATAVSGSGPGFAGFLLDSFIEAAKSIGFDDTEAKLLVFETFKGTLLYLEKEKDLAITNFVSKVASKGGTTEAGLKVLEKNKVKDIITNTIHSAFKRAKELSS